VELLTEARKKVDNTKDDNDEKLEALETLKDKFFCELDDDFNTAGAIGVLFDLVKQINVYFSCTSCPSAQYVERVTKLLQDFLQILGLDVNSSTVCGDECIKLLVAQRQLARANGNFKEADEIREQLKKMGVSLEDTHGDVKVKINRGGTSFERKS
jgi:cysteinyl-tRNA synthetase